VNITITDITGSIRNQVRTSKKGKKSWTKLIHNLGTSV